jgi:hypothetical protein
MSGKVLPFQRAYFFILVRLAGNLDFHSHGKEKRRLIMNEKSIMSLAAVMLPVLVAIVGVEGIVTGEITLAGTIYTDYQGAEARLLGVAALFAALSIHLDLSLRIDPDNILFLGMPRNLIKNICIGIACAGGTIGSML